MLRDETLAKVEPEISKQVADLIERQARETGEVPDKSDLLAIAEFAFFETLRRASEGNVEVFGSLTEGHVRNCARHVISELLRPFPDDDASDADDGFQAGAETAQQPAAE